MWSSNLLTLAFDRSRDITATPVRTVMAKAPRLGKYQHRAHARMDPAAPGAELSIRKRRPFPYLGVLLISFAVVAPILCSGLALLWKALGHMPKPIVDAALPSSPTLNNILFGAGLPEVALAAVVCGYLLWTIVWRMPVSQSLSERGTWPLGLRLLTAALPAGVFCAGVGALIGTFGLCIRAAPVSVPVLIRPLFAIPAVAAAALNALFQPVVIVTILLLGVAAGSLVALVAALAWERFPMESRG